MTPEERRRAGKAVEERMGDRGKTAAQVAKDSEINRKTLQALLTGTRWPTVAVRTRVEHTLEWPTGEILRRGRDGLESLAGYEESELLSELLRRSRMRTRRPRAN